MPLCRSGLTERNCFFRKKINFLIGLFSTFLVTRIHRLASKRQTCHFTQATYAWELPGLTEHFGRFSLAETRRTKKVDLLQYDIYLFHNK